MISPMKSWKGTIFNSRCHGNLIWTMVTCARPNTHTHKGMYDENLHSHAIGPGLDANSLPLTRAVGRVIQLAIGIGLLLQGGHPRWL